MRLTKYTHACVRIERDGAVLVIDPGAFSEADALAGADAILVTHNHMDHLDPAKLRTAVEGGATVYGPADLADTAEGVPFTTVASGQTFEAAGFTVDAVGDRHAEVWRGQPDIANLGYLFEGIYHPGDANFVPEQEVETLLIPVSGPWFVMGAGLDTMASIKPARAFPIHDAVNSDIGNRLVDGWFGRIEGTAYRRLAPGESADV